MEKPVYIVRISQDTLTHKKFNEIIRNSIFFARIVSSSFLHFRREIVTHLYGQEENYVQHGRKIVLPQICIQFFWCEVPILEVAYFADHPGYDVVDDSHNQSWRPLSDKLVSEIVQTPILDGVFIVAAKPYKCPTKQKDNDADQFRKSSFSFNCCPFRSSSFANFILLDLFSEKQQHFVGTSKFPICHFFLSDWVPSCTIEHRPRKDDSIRLEDLLVLSLFVKLNPHI